MRALVLSGGAVKGAYQVGVLKRWMGEQDRDYEIMCGVSVGALNVAGLAHTPKGNPKAAIAWLEDFWLSKVKGTDSIHKRWFPFGRLHSLWKKSVYDSSPLVKLIHDNMDLSKVIHNGRRLAVGAVCLDDGTHSFGTEQDPRFGDWVLASASYPVFLAPVEIDGKLWSDGGIINITPLGQAIRMGATEIDVIMCSDPWTQAVWQTDRKVAVPDQIVRTLNLMSDQIMRSDIELIGLKNELADISSRYKSVKVRVVHPSEVLVDNSLEFDPIEIRRMMQVGYDDADRYVVYE